MMCKKYAEVKYKYTARTMFDEKEMKHLGCAVIGK